MQWRQTWVVGEAELTVRINQAAGLCEWRCRGKGGLVNSGSLVVLMGISQR
jgi:hypothetical protein